MFNLYQTKGDDLERVFEKIFADFNLPIKGKVLIKPNFSGRPPLIPGENTDPEFLKELTNFLIKNGANEVLVLHGALLGTADRHYPFEQIIKGGGFAFLYDMPKVRLVDLDKEPSEIVEHNGVKFSIPKILKEVNMHINLAKVKTHMEATVSLALKNQMGLVAMGNRISMHKIDLEKHIAYLAKLVKPTINIVDGIIAMEGNGPHHGSPTNLNTIFVGDDMVETDSIISHLLGLDFKKIKHVKIAEEIGAGNFPSQETLGKFEKYKFSGFKPAMQYEKFGKNVYAWPTTSCSRCITAVNETGKLLKKKPLKYLGLIRKVYFGNKKINIIFGNADETNTKISKSDKNVFVGSCAKEFANKCGGECLDKCPPTVEEAAGWIKKKS